MIMMRTRIAKHIFVCFVFVLGLAPLTRVMAQLSQEDGSAEHPYLIESLQELNDFHLCMIPGNAFYFYNGTYQTTRPAGTENVDYRKIPQGCKQKHIKLTCDIVVNTGNVAGCNGVKDSSWTAWTPMEIFYGYFDGDYHVISGLFCTTRDSSTNSRHERGFFTQISDSAKVMRLGITNSYIAGARAVGGITGWMLNRSEVSECFFEGTLAATDINTGGIVGIAEQWSVVKDCYSSGTIYADKHYVGGIAGLVEREASLTNCYSSMIIYSDESLTGAIAGYKDNSVISNCFYDKQFSTLNTNNYATGLLTSAMADASWTMLGAKFTPANGLYPRITGFSMSNPSVVMSVMPVFMNAVSALQYDDVSNLTHDFTLGTYAGTSWDVESWNNCISISGLNAHLEKQGVADLMVKMDTLSRTYILYPNVAPFLGSESNPFIIDNLEDLTNFRNGINGGIDFRYRRFLITYSNLPNIHWLQTSDIDLASVANWSPVGTSAQTFKGYYDGGNHTILNLKNSIASGSGGSFGLFGEVNSAVIKKINFENAIVSTNNGYASILCGRAYNTTFDYCNVNHSTLSGRSSTGAICGYGSNVVVKNCVNENGSVAGNNSGGVAGIIGECWPGTISQCRNYSSVSNGTETGGIVGVGNGTITFCLNCGNIQGGGDEAGGISGQDMTISYCINTGNVRSGWVGGIQSWNSATINQCINTGTCTVTNAAGGGISRNCPSYHCCNFGKIVHDGANSRHIAGISGETTANFGYSVCNMKGTQNCVNPVGSGTNNCFYDSQVLLIPFSAVGGTTALKTSEMIGPTSRMRATLGDTYWLYEEGMYPRLKWTDTIPWAREIAIAACSPALLGTDGEDYDNVKPGLRLMGCDSNVTWKQMPQSGDGGCLFVDLAAESSCNNNAITPALNSMCIGPTTVGAYIHDSVWIKTIVLRRYIEPTRDTLTIDSLGDLRTLQAGVNSGEAFYYKEYLLPRFADNITFRFTADIAMPNSNWVPIGGNSYTTSFNGKILGCGHTISNLHCNSTYSGLFGRVSGTIRDLNFEGVSISDGTYKGAVCAELIKGKITNCHVLSGSISGGNYYTGGIVGLFSSADTIANCTNYATISCGSYGRCGGIVGQGNGNLKVINCHNYATVYGSEYAGGIIGLSGSATNCHNEGAVSSGSRAGGIIGEGSAATNCYNKGSVTGNYRVGGIIGNGGSANTCYNIGAVTGNSSAEYTGGICGVGSATNCYNVGTVTAVTGNATANHYVGGVCGSGSPTKCYNAGIVYGNNRKYVGGIVGTGAPTYCYNSNTARSTGTYLGGVSAVSNNSISHCYYDQQLCPAGGIAGTDVPGKAEGLTTQEMLSNGMSSLLNPGGSSYWTYQTLLYPQLTTFAGTSPSLSSVMPVKLTDNETWNQVTQGFYMHGCDVGEWDIIQGSCIELDTASAHCETRVTGVGVAQLGASVNDTVYRKVRLLINVGEDNPLVIKNLTELKNFRDVINRSIGYYKISDQTFHPTLTAAEADDPDFMEIQDGGLDLYFKLITDIDMTGEASVWQPIGDYATNNAWKFNGSFNGDNHTITGLKIGSGDRKGLFGQAYFEIKNLNLDRCSMTGTGTNKGFLCGVNYADITNCAVTNSKATGGSAYTGSLLGYHGYGTVKHCYGDNDTIQTTGVRAGGLCGFHEYGVIDSCYSNHLYMTGAGTYKGGVVGYNDRARVLHCDILNSDINVTGSDVGGICGYNHSNDGSNPAYIQYCNNRNTNVYSTNVRIGGIAGYNFYVNVYVYDCSVTGGTVMSTSDGVGGICGQQHYSGSDNRVLRCVNENPVSGARYIGGITGYVDRARIDSCENRATVNGTNYVGGILGYTANWSYVTSCVNGADVTGTGSCVGGIQGNMHNSNDSRILHSYNLGRVTGQYRVGGIVGQNYHGAISNCYNAGIVTGMSRLGGLIGEQVAPNVNSTNSYNTGFVKGTTMVGGVCGYSTSYKLSNCYYDMQLCPVGGANDVDQSYAVGKLTSEMTGTGMQSALGTSEWVYADGMFPRLTKIDTGAVALSSALPVWLPSTPDTVTAADVPMGHYGLAGCDSTSWERYHGYGLNFPSCDTLNVTGRNYVMIANVIDGNTLKVVRLQLGISEDNPLEIISLEQFKKFRDLVNSNQTFYYDDQTQIFYADEDDEYIKIEPRGQNMFFKLTTDIDLSLETGSWTPINDFRGHFNGDDHQVIGMKITTSGNNQGLFSTMYGLVKNVTMTNPSILTTGDNHGALVGYNEGRIQNCHVVGGTVKGSSYVGGLLGKNYYAQISNCYSNANVRGTNYLGGIVGYTTEGIITQCFNAGLINGSTYIGGITGYCNHELNYCYNAGAISGSSRLGGVVGWSVAPYIYYCYNAGNVHSTAATPQYVGAVVALDNTTYAPYYCYYDQQMCPLDGGIGQANTAINSSNRTAAKYTEQMVGTGLSGSNGWSDTYWTYTDSLYPRLKTMGALDASIVSVHPVFITEHLKCDEVSLPFTVKTNDSIAWTRHGGGNSLDISQLDDGQLRPLICGNDSLKVMLREDFKIVPLYVSKLQAATLVDTACGGYYLWAASGRIYTESGRYTVAITVNEGCDSVMNLQLTIPPALQLEMASQNYTCYESTDAYAEARVTGGFARGYLYAWTNAGGDTVSTTTRIDNPDPGTYHFSARDAVHPDCEISGDVTITKPAELVLTQGTADSRCYNQNDGIISFSVQGGTLPYVLNWTGTASGQMDMANAMTDTVSGLADGTYNLTVTDFKGCSKSWNDIVIADDETAYSVTAYGVSKAYDGVAVNPGKYILQVGSNVPDTITSGSYKVLANGDTLRASVSETASHTDVCNVTNTVTSCTITNNGEDRSCRYNLTTSNSIVEITKRNVTLTSASDSKTYDGVALTNRVVTVGGDGFAAGEDTLSCNVTGSQTLSGSSQNTFTYTLKPNTLASNYNIQEFYGSLVVATEGNVVVIANSASKTYDGLPLTDNRYTCSGATIASTDTLIATVVGTITDAGSVVNEVTEYKVVHKDDHSEDVTGSYTFDPAVNGTLTVNRRNVTLSTVSDSKTYDGTSLSRPTVTLSGDGFLAGEVTGYSATQSITNVGSVTNSITVDTVAGSYNRNNYNLTLNQGTLTVTKRALSINGDSRTILYDGSSHSVTTYTAPNLLTGDVISGISYSATGTNAGTYPGTFSNTANLQITNALSQDVTANYDVTFEPGTLTINASTLPLVVKSNSNSFMYDGQSHTYQSYTVLYHGAAVSPTTATSFELPTGDMLTITPTGIGNSGITHVSQSGRNTFSISLENASNYAAISLDTGTIAITARPVVLRSPNDWSVYTGTAIPTDRANTTVERLSYGFVGSEDVVCTITGSQINVGSSANTFTYVAASGTDLNDYAITSQYGTLTVAQATLTIVADNKNKTYGEANPAFTYSISGFVNGEDTTSAPFTSVVRPTMSTTATATSPAGLYPINIVTTGVTFQNYVVTPASGTLTINRRPLTVQALSVSGITYDGERHTWQESADPHYQITSGSLLAGDSIYSIIIAGGRTIGGTTQIEPSNAIIKHYNGGWGDDLTQSYEVTYANGNLTITPREITIKPLPYAHDFDGHTYNSSYTATPHYTITAGSLVGDDSIVAITINGSRSSYGKTPFVIDPSSIKIVDTTETHEYSDIPPAQLRTGGYQITLVTDTLTINHRSTPYEIDIYGKDSSMVYNGQLRSFSGWRNNEFEFDGFTYRVVDVVSKVENKDTVNTYTAAIVGTPRVLGANDEDVTAEFDVTTHPGTLTITKKPVTVTAKGVNVEYDFMQHSYKDNLFPYSTAVGLCTGHAIDTIIMTGAGTAAGRYPINIVANSVRIENLSTHADVTNNYQIATVDSALHITDRTSRDTFHLVSKSQTLTYDGTSHTLTGFDTLRFMVRAHDAQQTPVYFHIDPTSVSATTGSRTAAGTYKNVITGTPVVLDANEADVSGSFVVVADTGTLTINQLAVTITARDTNFYYDGNPHNVSAMVGPKFTATGLLSGHTAQATVTSSNQTEIGTTATIVGTVTISDASSNDVTANYSISRVNGTLTVSGFPGAITITSASAELECDGTAQKKEEYTVTYAGSNVAAAAGSNGKKFALPTVNHDTLTITPTFAGITTSSQNAVNNNTFTYVIQNDVQYVGTRTATYGTIKMYDSLSVAVTATPVTCNGRNDGEAEVVITGGKKNAGNYTYTLDGGAATSTTGTVNLTALTNGSHTFYVTDSLSYEKTVTITITQPDALTLTLTTDQPVYGDGTIMSLAAGGNGGYTFTLNTLDTTNHGIYNWLSAGSYTVKVIDALGCTATADATLTTTSVTEIMGLTRSGELTNFADDRTVNRNGLLTEFPALTPSGDVIPQPALDSLRVSDATNSIEVEAKVGAVGVATVLELVVATDNSFNANTVMYTYKLVNLTTGWKSHTFANLPAGTYYVRAKLYNSDGYIDKTSTDAITIP